MVFPVGAQLAGDGDLEVAKAGEMYSYRLMLPVVQCLQGLRQADRMLVIARFQRQ